MSFPPGSAPSIPADPLKGSMNWDGPLNAKLDAITAAIAQAWQNDIDAATAIQARGITPVVNSGTEIPNPVDGQVVYITSSRIYERYNGTSSAWVPFLTSGADGSFINSFQGAWSAQSYATGAIVTYQGSSWISTGAVSSSQVPGTDAAWSVIAADGTPGTPGATILSGTTTPTSGQGSNNDYYIQNPLTAPVFWGPKASGAWPGSGTALTGPQGPAGQGLATGGTTGQYLKKNSNTNFDDVWGGILDADINTLNSVTNKALDSAVVHLAGAETITGAKTFSVAPVVPSASFPESAVTNLTSDLAAKLAASGGTVTGTLSSTGGSAAAIADQSQVTGDTQQRYTQRVDGQMAWGSGAATTDATLRRSAVGVLATDNNLAAVQGVQVGSATTGFGGGVGVVGIANAATVPTSNPTGGGVFYADASSRPAWRDPSGNVWVLVPSANPGPADQGLIAWSFQPQLSTGQTSALTAGVIYLARVIIRSAATVSNVLLGVTTAGTSLANTTVGLYDFTGARQAVTADQSTVFQSVGFKQIAFTSTYAAPAGNYWVAVLVGSGTPPQLSGSVSSTLTASTANAGVTASTARWATNGTSQSALPSTITPASNATSNQAFLACLS